MNLSVRNQGDERRERELLQAGDGRLQVADAVAQHARLPKAVHVVHPQPQPGRENRRQPHGRLCKARDNQSYMREGCVSAVFCHSTLNDEHSRQSSRLL